MKVSKPWTRCLIPACGCLNLPGVFSPSRRGKNITCFFGKSWEDTRVNLPFRGEQFHLEEIFPVQFSSKGSVSKAIQIEARDLFDGSSARGSLSMDHRVGSSRHRTGNAGGDPGLIPGGFIDAHQGSVLSVADTPSMRTGFWPRN